MGGECLAAIYFIFKMYRAIYMIGAKNFIYVGAKITEVRKIFLWLLEQDRCRLSIDTVWIFYR